MVKVKNPLGADILVDTQPFVNCRKNCHPQLAAAIARLCIGWKENPASKRQRAVFSDLARHVDAALADHRSQLVSNGYRRSTAPGLHYSRYLQLFGRERCEWQIIKLHRLLRKTSNRQRDQIGSLEAFDADEGSPTLASVPATTQTELVLLEALDTLDSLRSLTNIVGTFREKAKLIRNVNVRKKWWERTCRFCEQSTEMCAFAEGKINLRESSGRQTLSDSLCRKHRSRTEDGKSSADYRRFRRAESELQREFHQLKWASVRKGPILAGSENAILYAFYRKIVDARNLYVFDELQLTEEARALVTQGMSDRKKLIVIFLCAGEGMSNIARQLGITRQAVFKSVQALPNQYRFDLVECSKS